MTDLQKYIDDISQYDNTVNENLVEVLYSSLAGSLASQDSANVACSDEKELKTVKENFIENKLGITDEAEAEEALQKVCTMMKGDNSKNRLVFYYLLTQELRCIGKMTDEA